MRQATYLLLVNICGRESKHHPIENEPALPGLIRLTKTENFAYDKRGAGSRPAREFSGSTLNEPPKPINPILYLKLWS